MTRAVYTSSLALPHPTSLGNSAAYDLIDSWSTVNDYYVSNN